jgi:hypothetical protein
MKVRAGFTCIVALMAAMVLVIVGVGATPDDGAELASSEQLTVGAVAAHDADGHTHDAADGHDHADGTADHDHADGTAGHDHADGTADHDHADGTSDEGHCHENCDPGTPVDPTHCHENCDPNTPTDPNHEHPGSVYTQPQLDLLAATQAWISPRFDNVADAVAAGYKSIGDSVTGFEHYVNNDFLNSPQVLTPATIESLVYKVNGNGRTLVSGMYILPIGQSFANVDPAYSSEHVVWHVHSNLCWRTNPLRVAGTTSTGQAGCPAGTIYFVTPPMLHVWLQEQPCGWFADLEQTNGDCTAHPH